MRIFPEEIAAESLGSKSKYKRVNVSVLSSNEYSLSNGQFMKTFDSKDLSTTYFLQEILSLT